MQPTLVEAFAVGTLFGTIATCVIVALVHLRQFAIAAHMAEIERN